MEQSLPASDGEVNASPTKPSGRSMKLMYGAFSIATVNGLLSGFCAARNISYTDMNHSQLLAVSAGPVGLVSGGYDLLREADSKPGSRLESIARNAVTPIAGVVVGSVCGAALFGASYGLGYLLGHITERA